MYSNTMELLSKRLDPISVLETVVEKITDAERCYPVDESIRRHFNLSEKSAGRNWGESRGDIEDVKLHKAALGAGFYVHFTYEEYARGCFMGTTRYEIFVPDFFVKLYEQSMTDPDSDAEERLEQHIEIHVKDIVLSLRTEVAAAEQKKKDEAEANSRAYEESERAEWERLNEKFGKVE